MGNDTLFKVDVLSLGSIHKSKIHTFLPLPAIPRLETIPYKIEIDSHSALIQIRKM